MTVLLRKNRSDAIRAGVALAPVLAFDGYRGARGYAAPEDDGYYHYIPHLGMCQIPWLGIYRHASDRADFPAPRDTYTAPWQAAGR